MNTDDLPRRRTHRAFGKLYQSTYTGSLYGKGANVHAVWDYVIAYAYDGEVELNPVVVAAAIGMTVEEVKTAIAFLMAPDPDSRSRDHEGRRLLRGEHDFHYQVPSHRFYRNLRDVDDRRETNREAKQRERSRSQQQTNATVTELRRRRS